MVQLAQLFTDISTLKRLIILPVGQSLYGQTESGKPNETEDTYAAYGIYRTIFSVAVDAKKLLTSAAMELSNV